MKFFNGEQYTTLYNVFNSEIRTARRRREMLITPCKRSAARGREDSLSSLHPVWGATGHKMLHSYGVPDMVGVFRLPRVTLTLTRGYSHIAPTGRSINGKFIETENSCTESAGF